MTFKMKRKSLRLRHKLGDDLERMVKIEKTTANDRRQTARHMKFARVIGRHHARLEPAQ